MYTIGEVSKMFNIPISTLRYYDKEGLFPNLIKESGIRKFQDSDLETIRVIECLKKTGLEIKEIKEFMEWCKEGNKTFEKRKELFINQKKKIEEEIESLNKTLAMVEFKCWYYTEAIKNNSDDIVKEMIPNNLPQDIKKLYDISHK